MANFSDGVSKHFHHLIVENHGEVSKAELFNLFNDSRALVVLSGRDCNPRIIQEAGMCGTRVLAADILSDGFESIALQPLLGAIILTKKESWFYQSNGNLIFDTNQKFVEKVLKEVSISKMPYATQRTAIAVYSLELAAKQISTTITSLR